MGNYHSSLSNFDDNLIKIMSYNVEWGFFELPLDVKEDACGNKIPNNKNAQINHLKLVAKNIGLLSPSICFLQEIGSKEVLQYLSEKIYEMFHIKYAIYYSNNDEVGFQGVGLLLLNSENFLVENITNFPLNRALSIKSKR